MRRAPTTFYPKYVFWMNIYLKSVSLCNPKLQVCRDLSVFKEVSALQAATRMMNE